MDQPPAHRTLLLACTARSLARYWLHVSCRRGKRANVPLAHVPGSRTIADTVLRLRCMKCRERRPRAELVDDPRALLADWLGPPPWRVVLIDDESPRVTPPDRLLT
jgi:hypothetical protein